MPVWPGRWHTVTVSQQQTEAGGWEEGGGKETGGWLRGSLGRQGRWPQVGRSSVDNGLCESLWGCGPLGTTHSTQERLLSLQTPLLQPGLAAWPRVKAKFPSSCSSSPAPSRERNCHPQGTGPGPTMDLTSSDSQATEHCTLSDLWVTSSK